LSQFSVANCQDHFKITYRYNFSVPAHARSWAALFPGVTWQFLKWCFPFVLQHLHIGWGADHPLYLPEGCCQDLCWYLGPTLAPISPWASWHLKKCPRNLNLESHIVLSFTEAVPPMSAGWRFILLYLHHLTPT
jgi:hypothetical protein